MRRARSAVVVLALVVSSAQIFATDAHLLAAKINAILADPEIARGFWGIEIISLTSGQVLYSHNADKLFIPASNTKLFTTAAALALIGPDYRCRTTLETTGTIGSDGRLHGDLMLVGRGDPNLSGRVLPYSVHSERSQFPIKALEDLADAVLQKGIKRIEGDVVADDSYFAFERYGEGWTQDDLVWADGAPVSALTINDNVIFVDITPARRAGEGASVTITPFSDYYRIDNRIITTPAGTGRKIFINREPGSMVLTLWGNMPVSDPGANEALAVEDPAAFAGMLFGSLLAKRGIVLEGRIRTHHTELASLSTFSVTALASHGGGDTHGGSLVPKEATVLTSYESRPLRDDVRVINKVSQNLHAELLLRVLGHEKGTTATIEGGLEVLRGFLTQVGIPNEQYAFYDGSGLSRQNLVTPSAVVALLQYAAKQPWGTFFAESLPVAGMDGSLADRMRNTPAQGLVLGKTGSLDHVKSLSGYATTVSGDRVVFSIFANNFDVPGHRAQDAIDTIVEAIVGDAPLRTK
ncbi:MAG: D-alanyl-D-alanine carboxypeptidase/D-alanyl-D-alanine-endopeptidase [Acidobacteria bacterium]|nr:D-alanyl-D-alanine carboxypeptidase/D-alanyl-D-alanine-endopeptidase [Acidobacteriota bacterium]